MLTRPELGEVADLAHTMLQEVASRINRLLAADDETASAVMRPIIDRMCQLTDWVSLATPLQWELQGRARRLLHEAGLPRASGVEGGVPLKPSVQNQEQPDLVVGQAPWLAQLHDLVCLKPIERLAQHQGTLPNPAPDGEIETPLGKIEMPRRQTVFHQAAQHQLSSLRCQITLE